MLSNQVINSVIDSVIDSVLSARDWREAIVENKTICITGKEEKRLSEDGIWFIEQADILAYVQSDNGIFSPSQSAENQQIHEGNVGVKCAEENISDDFQTRISFVHVTPK